MLQSPVVNDIIEGTIQTLAFGGKGILRHQGFVIFIPFTAPGDTITCRITSVKKSFAEAELLSIEQAARSRVEPLCPYFGVCGGCQIQHLNPEAQLNYKQHAVEESLQRIGHLSYPTLPIQAAEQRWAYRRHVTLHLKAHDGYFKAGYITVDNTSLLQIQTCPIFNEPQDPIIKDIQTCVSRLPSSSSADEGRLIVLKNNDEGYILYFQFSSPLTIEAPFFKQMLKQFPSFSGIIVQTPKEEQIFGDPYTEEYIDGINFRFTPQTFVQNHSEQSQRIYQKICDLAANQTAGRTILDLYCGFGITTLLLAARGHRVMGVEYNPKAIEFAKDNMSRNRILGAKFKQGDVERLLPSIRKQIQPDLIVVNPPRTGMSKQTLQHLLAMKAKELIYVSCMPSTLARDSALLCEKIYKIKEGGVYDMFPQTAHVETLLHFVRKDK